VKYSG